MKKNRKPQAVTVKGVMPVGQFNKHFGHYLAKRQYDRADYFVDDVEKEQCIWWAWSAGGASGGSCWDEAGDEGAVEFDGVDEPHPNQLQLFLTEYFPRLTTDQCKQIQASAHQFMVSDTIECWYGNGEDFNVKSISRSVLLEKLQRMGCVGSS